MMNKKRKIVLKFWIIFIFIILLILLFLLVLRLPKLLKIDSKEKEKQKETQSEYQKQYIYDTNKVQNIVILLTKLKTLKQLKNKQLKKQVEKQKETQPINNLDFFDPKVQNDLYHKLSKSMDEQMIQFSQKYFVSSEVPSEQLNDDNQLVKYISVVTLATGAVIITCAVLTPIFASVGPLSVLVKAPLAVLL